MKAGLVLSIELKQHIRCEMGHYDDCRPGYCVDCGQAEGVIWGCGREYCKTYHEFLRRDHPEDYQKLMLKIKVEKEVSEEKRVTKRQIKRRITQIAQEAKEEACD